MANDLTEGRDPAKLLRWIINETATPNYNNNPQATESSNNNDESKENIPITRLSDMGEEEKQKWTQIILGQTPDILNNRASLQQAIEKLHEIKGKIVDPSKVKNNKTDNAKKPTKSKDKDEDKEDQVPDTELQGDGDPNEEIKICISIIHNLLDKNEAVLQN
eukprot:CAMPEP_0201595438 /NCGR_PEP_ID=MMETSP0190_2-20130828/192440_1 /ASSEMBLY_ACC=CAM_ASM_000263 /TAXON_ID=37353 /ORGANISM="Rosalina sp." /LENGTH=161 /DNA_ID=CAMNT_0048055423 /DNA_START=28 /DNA_END=514 /DNA_ORIENTATION=+